MLPYKGDDGGFTYVSIVERVPQIIQEIINNNNYSQETNNNLQNLLKSISTGGLIPKQYRINDKQWTIYENDINIEKSTWLSIPWFFFENFMYRLILDIVDYFHTKIDPFEKQKRQVIENGIKSKSFEKFIEWVKREYEKKEKGQVINERYMIKKMFYSSLYGNQVDLSLSGGKINNKEQGEERKDFILIDDIDEVVGKEKIYSNISIIIDNNGLELYNDLLLIDGLIRLKFVKMITIYCKTNPVFVSDAMEKDIMETIKELTFSKNENCKFLGESLTNLIEKKCIVIKDNIFFNSPLPFNKMDSSLKQELSQQDLVITKGDANYRRLLNDCKNLEDKKFQDLLSYFPTNLIALRTLKSGPLCETFRIKNIDKLEDQFRVNGKYGILQFYQKVN